MSNRRVKLELKIPNRLGKNVKNTKHKGGGDSHCTPKVLGT